MNSNPEQQLISSCIELIEQKINSKKSADWGNRDFEYLSDLIYDKSNIKISSSTLRRIWQNEYQTLPQISTLNALAIFLGYESWYQFKNKKLEEQAAENQNIYGDTASKIVSKRRIPLKIGLAGLFLLLFFITLFLVFNNKAEETIIDSDKVQFSIQKNLSSGVPNTVGFHYDISQIEFDSAFIQQDWNPLRRVRITADKHFQSAIYYWPGVLYPRIVINNQEVKAEQLLIKTNGWTGFYTKDVMQWIPSYFYTDEIKKKGKLYISPSDLQKKNIQSGNDYYIIFGNFMDYGEISYDNFTLETEIRNNIEEGGLTCQYSQVSIRGTKGGMFFSFTEPGCTHLVKLGYYDVTLSGTENDFSDFGCKLSDWRKVKIKMINKEATIYLDGKEIYKLEITRDLGEIKGITLTFKGCGAVNFVKLVNKNEELVYEDDFDGIK